MGATMSDLLHWWNVLFLVPIALAVLLLLVNAVAGLGDAGDAGGAADHDVSADAGDGADGGADGDGADGEADHPFAGALRSLGVGAVPLSLLVQAFLLFFGIWGLAANRLLSVAAHPDIRIWPALGLALVGGLATAGGLGAIGRRFLPKDGPATGGKDLLARTGRVVFAVDDDGGTVQVRDGGGTLHQVPARHGPGAGTIPAGRTILIVAHDRETGVFTVEESPFEE
jgi:hypothetical protein